jgi:hypothetical protein
MGIPTGHHFLKRRNNCTIRNNNIKRDAKLILNELDKNTTNCNTGSEVNKLA